MTIFIAQRPEGFKQHDFDSDDQVYQQRDHVITAADGTTWNCTDFVRLTGRFTDGSSRKSHRYTLGRYLARTILLAGKPCKSLRLYPASGEFTPEEISTYIVAEKTLNDKMEITPMLTLTEDLARMYGEHYEPATRVVKEDYQFKG
jgi:hypothetical protein